jgi:O-antigen ligase
MIFLLSSRTQILILMGIFLIHAFVYLKNTYGYLISITASLFLFLFVLGIVLMIPINRERFKQAINYNGEYSVSTKWGDSQIRYLIWDSSLEVISTHIFTGVGTGDVQEVLQAMYIKSKRTTLTYFSDVRYNAHNQFLETTIALGLGGLVVLLAMFLLPIGYAWRTKNSLYAAFLLIFFASCLTESMLERQNGIVFYAFFNSLLFTYSINSNNEY